INMKINGKYTVNYNDNINVEFESDTHRITKDVYNEYWNEIYKQNEIDRMDRYVEREERDKDYLTITANRVKRRKNKC
ncbi:hypothetical protein, partial [Paraclostridium bifermentans]|uniref:hypothetical protein n=1 Tax=Paraclostridium bifermentans TaxID=1490 RepID=UPI0022E2E4CA